MNVVKFQNHFFVSPYKPVTIKIKESAIENSNSEKLLGVTIDSKLSFDDDITILCCNTRGYVS